MVDLCNLLQNIIHSCLTHCRTLSSLITVASMMLVKSETLSSCELNTFLMLSNTNLMLSNTNKNNNNNYNYYHYYYYYYCLLLVCHKIMTSFTPMSNKELFYTYT